GANGRFVRGPGCGVVVYSRLIAIGDFNGDGRTDLGIVTQDYSYGDYWIDVFYNDGNWGWGPNYFLSDATVTEGNTGTTNASFTLSLAYADNADLTFHYATADGSATAGSDYQSAYGNAGTTSASFTVRLEAASTETISVAYATGDGSAAAGGDYQSASGTVTFAPGETSKTITVLVNGDRLPEPNETFPVNLSSPTN